MKILLAAPTGWATDALCGLLRKLAPGAEVHVVPDARSLDTPGGPADLILLDIDVEPTKASSIVADAARNHASSRIVAMGSQEGKRHVESLIEAGALTYLPHSFTETVITGTLHLIIDNLKASAKDAGAAPSDANLPESSGPATPGEDGFGLTRRQADVLALVCEGKANRSIAQALGISEGVVKLHVTAIHKALKVRSRAEAILVASRSRSVTFRQLKKAEGGKLDLDWLLGHMTHERLPRDSFLFRIGDPAGELYYLQRGAIRLEEINTELPVGTMFGEIGIFSPSQKRTCSAVCTATTDVFKLTSDQVKRLYLLNPQFALYIVHLISQRLMADRARVT